MLAEEVLSGIAAIIVALTGMVTAVAASAAVVYSYLTHRTQKRDVLPTLCAVDAAVNGQPAGTQHMVDKVSGIVDEQARVAAEKTGDDAQRTSIIDEQARVATELAASPVPPPADNQG
jgi:hypothetical protein